MRRKFHTPILIVSFVLIAHLCQAALSQSAVSRQSKAPVHILGSDGFIRDWFILGMFPNSRNTLDTADSGFHKDYLSAIGGEAKAEVTLNSQVSYTDESGTRRTAQVQHAQTAPSGVLHFDKIYGRIDYRLAYAFCYIESDRDQTVTGYFGSNDDAKVWVNGELVHEYPLPRSCKARQDTFTFRLQRGQNRVLVKICERWGDWAARPRLLESHAEEPSLQLIQDGPHSAMAVSYLAHQGTKSRKSALGPGKHACTFNRYIQRGYLHPSSLQGHDLSRIKTPIPPNVDEIRNDFPFVVLTPQVPDEYDAWPGDLVVDLVDEMVKQYNVDARRVYVTGFSLGGRGSWSVAVDYPEVFAAIAPVAGSYGQPERISRIKDVPVWVFHGDSDRLLPIDPVRNMVQDLKESGGNVRFTIYEGAGHSITGRIYRTRELYEWLLKQHNE